MKTAREIEDMWAEASERAQQRTKLPSMTYEQGVEAALEWVMQGGDSPLAD